MKICEYPTHKRNKQQKISMYVRMYVHIPVHTHTYLKVVITVDMHACVLTHMYAHTFVYREARKSPIEEYFCCLHFVFGNSNSTE